MRACVAALRRLVKTRTPKYSLDLGCGLGELSYPLARAAPLAQVVGVDRDAAALAHWGEQMARVPAGAARTQGVHAALEAVASGAAQLPPGPYDLIVCTAVLQYVADAAGLLRRAHALAAAEGRLLLYVPVHYRRVLVGFDGWVARAFAGQDYDRQAGVQHRYTAAEVLALLEATGWQLERAQAVTGRLGQLHYELHTLLLYATRAWGWPLALLALYLPVGVALAQVDHWLQHRATTAQAAARRRASANGLLVVARK